MIKTIIKHKLAELAIDNLFNNVILNFSSIPALREGDKFSEMIVKYNKLSIILHNVEIHTETYYSKEELGIYYESYTKYYAYSDKYMWNDYSGHLIVNINNIISYKGLK